MERLSVFLFPVVLPIFMVVILMLLSSPHRRMEWTELPGRLCYAALTFDLWAVSTRASGQKVRYISATDPPWQLFTGIVLTHVIFAIICTLTNPDENVTRWRLFRAYLWGSLAIFLAVYMRY